MTPSPSARLAGALAASALLLVTSCRSGGVLFHESAPAGRLPEGVRPVHYAIELDVVPSHETFSGRVAIELELARPVRTIWMHGRGLDVSRVELEGPDGARRSARWEPAKPPGVAGVRLPEAVGPGRAVLHVDYRAAFDRRLRGLYRVDVGDDAYVFTQFQPLHARRAFPGFDEPRFKTPFDVTLRVPEDAVAIANTPEVERTPEPSGLVRIRYATTPPLPSYLLAWAVGPFDVRGAPPLESAVEAGRRIPFRGVAPRGRGDELHYALSHTPALLAALERYFAVPYPYAKLDVIAVPDFPAGAMENVGAITFREDLLLLDDSRDDVSERRRRELTYVMAHELAHQWFGNLVTIPWWNDLWLNEAFATWLGYRVVQETAPDQQAQMTLLRYAQHAMREDSRASSRRIRQPIESAHDVANAFDAITYSKGGAVLGMFEHWLGDETFREGIRRYVRAHRGGNARSEDLTAALSQAAGRDLRAPFASFLDQPGVPLIEAHGDCASDAGPAALVLRQSRDLPLGSRADRDLEWQVPVCARWAAGGALHEACELLDAREGRLPLPGDACPDWVMPNADAAGYYRFTLPPDDTRRLLERGLPALSPEERLALADSLTAAFRSGRAGVRETFGALARLARDESRPVALAPQPLLEFAREYLVEAEERAAVESFVERAYRPRFDALGWEPRPGEDGETALLRRAVIALLVETARDDELRGQALERGLRWAGLAADAADASPLAPDLVQTVLVVAVQDGGAPVFDALLARLHASEDASERTRLLRALGAARDPALAARARDLSLDPRLRVNEVATTLGAQMARAETRADAWTWIREHADELVSRMGESHAGWLPWLAGGFCSQEDAREVQAFLGPRIDRLQGGPRNLAAVTQSIRLCAALVAHHRDEARTFFRDALSRDPAGAR